MNLSQAILHILFIGNSLTYYNNLPSLVSDIAKQDGVELNFEMIALPDYAIEDHWNDGSIQKALKDEHYDFLVAQQGPSALPESQEMLKKAAIVVGSKCKKTNTQFALYGVWPSTDRSFDRDNCIASYANAAKASDALLCPAGLSWKLAWKKDPKLPLYGPDGFHPSIHGSVLAAMTIYAAVRKKKDLDFIKTSQWKQISDVQLEVMKSAAIESLNGL